MVNEEKGNPSKNGKTVGPDTHKKWIDVSILPLRGNSSFSNVTGYAIRFNGQSSFGWDEIDFTSSYGLVLKTRDHIENRYEYGTFFLPGLKNKKDLPMTIYLKKSIGEKVLKAIHEFNQKHEL